MITILAAVAENGIIGKCGELPWHLPQDLRRFKERTMGHTCVVGRKTYDKLPPLPGRNLIVLSQTLYPIVHDGNVIWMKDVNPASFVSGTHGDILVIGGAAIYEMFLPHAQGMEITRIHRFPEGDTYFPPIPDDWSLRETEPGDGVTYETWLRKIPVEVTW